MNAVKLQFLIVAVIINKAPSTAFLNLKMLSCKLIVVLMCVSCCVAKGLYGFRTRRPAQTYLAKFCEMQIDVKDTTICKHGAAQNICTKLACLKGVDEWCDEVSLYPRFGKCAEGLMCYCNKCTGCIDGNCTQVLCAEADYYLNNNILQK